MKLNQIDLNKVAIFCQIVESGNYRLASEVLNVTPSALSQTITSLEHSLGIPLFHRLGRKLVPSPSGLLLQREFRQAQRGLFAALSEVIGQEGEVSGVLRVGAYLEFAKSQLTPLLKEFLLKYPECQVKLTFDTPTRLQRLLETNRLDLCFSIYPSRESRLLESRPIYHQELVMIAPKNSRLSSHSSMEEIIANPVIEYYSNHQPLRRWLHLHFKKRPKHLSIRAFASTAEMVLALVSEGTGIGIIPLFLLGKDQKNVRVIRPSPKKFLDHIWLLEQKGAVESLARKEFKKAVIKKFKP